jgi:hypothetical protein
VGAKIAQRARARLGLVKSPGHWGVGVVQPVLQVLARRLVAAGQIGTVRQRRAQYWRAILEQDSGIANVTLENLGIIDAPIPWLSSPDVALIAVILVNIWPGIPFNLTLLYSGLQDIPDELYEAVAQRPPVLRPTDHARTHCDRRAEQGGRQRRRRTARLHLRGDGLARARRTRRH